MSTKPAVRKIAARAKSAAVAAHQKRKLPDTTHKIAGRQRTTPKAKRVAATPIAATTPPSKQARLIAILTSPAGSTLEQMMALTGWQAHSVRGVISGVLRKKLGFDVQCAKPGDNGVRVYRIAVARTAA